MSHREHRVDLGIYLSRLKQAQLLCLALAIL